MQAEVSILDRTPAALPRLRIAVVSETWPPEVNGVSITVSRCVEALRQRGHELRVLRPRQPGDGPDCRDALCGGWPVPGYPALRMGTPALGWLRRQWQDWRPDLVHVVTEGPLGWAAMRTARQLHLPVVADFHTNFHAYGRHYGWGWLASLIYGYLRRFHNSAQLTLVPTRAMRERLLADGFRRLDVVARGVDTALFRPSRRCPALRSAWGVAADGLAVLHVGRLAAEKNLALLHEAFAAIQARVPAARLVLVGDGPEREDMAAAASRPVLAGTRRGEDLARHYASADLFLFPSLTETFGNVTLEAMASGLPVVAYDYAAAAEHLQHGETGWLAPFDDAAGFVQGAAWLAGSPTERQRMGAAAVAVSQALNWECVVDALEAALRRTLQPDAHALQPPPLPRRPGSATPVRREPG